MTTRAGSDQPSSSVRLADAEGTLVAFLKRVVDSIGQWTAVWSGFYRSRADIPREDYDQARVDRLLVVWWILLIVCYTVAYRQFPYARPLVVALPALRIVNITFWNLRAALVETAKTPEGRSVHQVTSAKRSLVLGMVSFLELIVAFGCIYAAFPTSIHLPAQEVPNAGVYLYFSSITQLTVGYGDVAPLSWLRLVAVVQGLSGLVLLTVTIGRFLALVRVGETGRP